MDYFDSKKSVRKIPVRTVENSKNNAAPHPNHQPATDAKPESPPDDDNRQNGRLQPAETDWKALALRQQADMENFRKRQERRADEAVTAERERLLELTLSVADNLNRALNQDTPDEASLRQGVKLTYRELMRLLQAEGVTRLETVGQPFDPNWHEAVASVPAQAESNTIIEEIEAGYKLGDRLLRPARVVVAA